MNWYYVENGQQAGPVTEEQFSDLVRGGKIQPETLVWREGMAAWAVYGQAIASANPTSSTAAGSAEYVAGQGPEAVCAECGKLLAIQDMIRHGNIYVCANCKPVFMQKLAEGAPINSGQLNYAAFWTRFAAVFLDGLILMFVNFGIGLIAGLTASQAAGVQPRGTVALQITLLAIQITIGICYEGLLVGKYGATLGKMACKVRVVTADGARVTYPRAFARCFAKMLSGMICLIGYIIAGFDSQRRALHDYICNTRVIFK